MGSEHRTRGTFFDKSRPASVCLRLTSSRLVDAPTGQGEPAPNNTTFAHPKGGPRMKHGYLIDMDGVLYRGHELIPGADQFVRELRARSIPFLLLTNNSQRTRRDVAAKLARIGIDVEDSHIFTSAMATARFLGKQKPQGTAFVIGEGGLLTALHQNGYAVVDHEPDYVVVGEGRTFNLELVEAAVRMILGGAKLVATNLDPNCPTPDGLRPGCGAMVSMLEIATGVKAFSVGKPSPVMMRAARKELELTTEETTIIGDTMETDILGGVQLGFHTVLVLSGGTRQEDLARYAYRPEIVIASLAEFSQILTKREWHSPWQPSPGPNPQMPSARPDLSGTGLQILERLKT
jgi:NagD protein